MKIKKAVIPVAGKGTRFLPATKEIPKEMIPILNIPMIHHVVKEAIDSGIEQIVFVTSSGKEALENYFDKNAALEAFLKENNKLKELELISEIGSMVDIITVRQKEQLGLGHAILCAEAAVGNEPFAVLLGDDLVWGDKPVTRQLIKASEENNMSSVIGVMEVPNSETFRYGIVDGKEVAPNTLKMNSMVEKPKPEEAPTNLATPGRYILSNSIFDYLKKIKRGVGGEYQLTDALNMMAHEEDVYAYIFEGERFDTGSIKGYLDATLDYALRNAETKDVAEQIIKEKIKKYKLG